MLKVGLTGGIGCGKTTVSNLFLALSVPVIDADTIAHQLVAVGQPALAQIQELFGSGILNPDGSLHRKKLRELIFANAAHKQQLEALLHPLVQSAIQTELTQLDSPYCIISVPLLFETKMTPLVDRIVVVDCPVASQIERVQKRDALPLSNLQAIIASQVPRSYRLAHADDVIDNSLANGKLADDVKKLHNFYLLLSAH